VHAFDHEPFANNTGLHVRVSVCSAYVPHFCGWQVFDTFFVSAVPWLLQLLHLPLNTFSSRVLCDSGISPPGNSLRKSFNKEARVGISPLSRSGKPPWSKLFLKSWQSFTFPPTRNRPLSLRPKHKHTFNKNTQSQLTWTLRNTGKNTHHASPQAPLCARALEEDPASSVHSSSGWSEAHQTQPSVFPPAHKFKKKKTGSY